MKKLNQLLKYVLIVSLVTLVLFFGPPLAIGIGIFVIVMSALYIYKNPKKDFYLKSLIIPLAFAVVLFVSHIPAYFLLVGWEREALPLLDLAIIISTLIISAIVNGIVYKIKLKK